MLGIANKIYMKKSDSNPYLGQQYSSYRTSMYVTGPGPRFVRGAKNMFPYFRGYMLCGEAYRIFSGTMSHFLYLKLGSKIDCVVYTGNAKRECIIL